MGGVLVQPLFCCFTRKMKSFSPRARLRGTPLTTHPLFPLLEDFFLDAIAASVDP